MEENINIAAILKDKPNGIRLYSPIFGECTFCCVREDTNDICVKKHNGVKEFFDSKGLYYNTGEVMLFPSKEMRDWRKFLWKKGDVLVNEDGDAHVIFEGFDDDTYETFNGNYYLENNVGIVSFVEHEGNFLTSEFDKANKENAQEYISTIEECLGGKLNRETLEIEKTQPEFKDGDIVFVESHMLGINTSSIITAIFRKEKENDKYKFSPALCESNVHDTYLRETPVVLSPSDIKTFRLATEEEKKQFFSALANKGKAWDSEKKKVVNLKPKCEFKPFDKVLGRNEKDEVWEAELFSHYREESQYPFRCIGFSRKYCIPYNEETAHLLGTTDEWEGGKHD